jgi:oligopeptide/dipeptide ABC transporter ATP-binding protein
MPNDESLLVIENLKAYYSTRKGLVRAVDDVSLEIREGECVGLLGESGCGKTSLAYSIIGLFEKMARLPRRNGAKSNGSFISPIIASGILGLQQKGDAQVDEVSQEYAGVQGKIWFRGNELTSLSEEEMLEIRGEEITLIPQGLTQALNPLISVGYQTGEPLEIHDEDIRLIELRRKVFDYLNLVRLADSDIRAFLDPNCFSGGEAQRILIAMSLISGPYLVIADEPTSALDVTIQRQILNVLGMIRDEFNVSILLISHDAGVIAELADRVAVMYAGKIMEYGSAVQVFHQPAHPYSMGLMASFPTISMMQMKVGQKRPRIRGIPGDSPDPTNIPPGCPFHPRCNYAIDKCTEEIPDYREVEPRHWLRCHRWGEIQNM